MAVCVSRHAIPFSGFRDKQNRNRLQDVLSIIRSGELRDNSATIAGANSANNC